MTRPENQVPPDAAEQASGGIGSPPPRSASQPTLGAAGQAGRGKKASRQRPGNQVRLGPLDQESRGRGVVAVGWSSGIVLVVASLAGLGLFVWPLFVPAQVASAGHLTDAPWAVAIILPVVVLLVFAQLSEGGLDAKAVAILGVLSAVGAALRPLGAGTGGIETVFFLIVLAGRVFGPGFGFALGCTSLFASALLTAGIGPWLPFQMLASAWIGLGAGLLPDHVIGHPLRGRGEIAMLAVYGVVAAYLFGALMNLWFWPFATGATMVETAALAYVPGAPIGQNLRAFGAFTLVTSTGTWDTGRAITDAALIILLGPSVLAALRRTARRAHFA